MKRLVGGAVLAFAVLTASASADLIPIGDPIEGNSWGQHWVLQVLAPPRNYDHIQMLMVTPGRFDTPIAIGNFSGPQATEPESWAQTFNDGSLVMADGHSTNYLWFTTWFPDNSSTSNFTFHLQAYDGQECVMNVDMRWIIVAGEGDFYPHYPGTWDQSTPLAVPTLSTLGGIGLLVALAAIAMRKISR